MSRWVAQWTRGYRSAWLRSDILAGVTTAAVVIPQAMAYAAVAGLPVQYGLYCAVIPTAAYALLGSSRSLSVSTTSTISLLTAAAIASTPAGTDPAEAAATLALITGAFLLVAAALRLGFASDFISRPVLAGFKIGMGLTIAASQLGKVLGITVTGDTFFPKIASALRHLDSASLATALVAAATVGALVGLRRAQPQLPGPLIVFVGAMGLMAFTALESRGVATVPTVPSGLPRPDVPQLDLVRSLLPSGAGIALMAFVESISSARAFRSKKDRPVEPNRELAALGVANVGGSLFHAFPAGGGLSQTAVNDRAGVRTQAAGLVTAAIAAIVLVALAPLFRYVPEAALGGIVLVAAAGLLARDELRVIRRQKYQDWIFALVTLGAVLVVGTLEGILVGVAVSLLTLLWQLNHAPIVVLGRRPGTDTFRSVEEHPGDERIADMLIVRIESPLYFGNAQRVLDRVAGLVDSSDPQPRVLVLDGAAISDADTTGAAVFSERADRLADAGTEVWLAGMTERVLDLARHSPRWSEFESKHRLYPTTAEAVAAFLNREPPA